MMPDEKGTPNPAALTGTPDPAKADAPAPAAPATAPATDSDKIISPVVTTREITPETGTVRDADRTPPDVGPEPNKLSATNAEQGEGETTVIGDRPPAAEDHIEVIADPEGKISNRVEGTIQREATPEELPPDAKIAPLAEQVAPNQAALAVGARPTPDEIAGVPQPEEGEKNVKPDTSDSTAFLSPESEQHDEASRADEDAQRDADRGRV